MLINTKLQNYSSENFSFFFFFSIFFIKIEDYKLHHISAPYKTIRIALPWVIANCSVAAFLACVRKGDGEEDIRSERG